MITRSNLEPISPLPPGRPRYHCDPQLFMRLMKERGVDSVWPDKIPPRDQQLPSPNSLKSRRQGPHHKLLLRGAGLVPLAGGELGLVGQ